MQLRDTAHLIVETLGGRWYIISSLCDRRDATVISIERYTGRLLYTAQPGVDLFGSAKEALHHIAQGKKIFKSVTKCHALIGYYIIGSVAYLLSVTKVSCDLVLPPRHRVYTVQDVEWIRIPLAYPVTQSKAEMKNAETMTDFLIKGAHYYCETLDLTRCFPSPQPVEEYDAEFCWNEFITLEFRNAGLGRWCCVLLQGIATNKTIKSEDALYGVNVALIYRRSSLNPGTRYLSRGLNVNSSPGNEYEVEQIVFKQQHGVVNWSSYFWRRGTVPIHWKSEINSAVADADIIISPKPYEKVDEYYKRMMSRYGTMSITVLNLLRTKSAHADEAMLADHFEESLAVVKKLMSIDIGMIHYDWHTLVKHLGIAESVNGLWEIMGPILRTQGITSGILRVSSKGKIMDTKVWRRQRGLTRINCADSLDRTNLCSFFIALHVIAEQCKDIGVSLCSKDKSPADLAESWATLGLSLETVKATYDKSLMHHFAEMFIFAGDICATLFTSTVAMHTQALRDFAPNPQQAPSNTKIIVERRIQNVMKDRMRQTQHEMFLGFKWAKYFPNHVKSMSDGRSVFLTPYPAFIFRSLPSELNMKLPEEHCILHENARHCWICPRDFDFVELQIYLPMYCRVTELALTVRHGISELSSPGKMDVFVGTHLDDCVMGFQEISIPRCDDATKLLYTLPPQISGVRSRNILYDFHETAPQSLMRVVRIVFYDIPPGFFMTLGQVQLFGVHDAITKSPKDFYLELSQMAANDIVEKIADNVIAVSAEEIIEIEDIENDPSPAEMSKQESLDEEAQRAQLQQEIEQQKSESYTEDDSDEDDDDIDADETPTTPFADTEQLYSLSSSEVLPSQTEQNSSGVMSNYFHSRNNSLNTLLERCASLHNKESSENEDQSSLHHDKQKHIMEAKEQYLEFLKVKCPDQSSAINFTDALELDLVRLKLGLGQKERDDVLVTNGYKVHKFNPNNFIFKRDEAVERSIRNKAKQVSKQCTLCRTGIKLRKYLCRYCRKCFCKNCTSRKKFKITEYGWPGLQQTCIECAEVLRKQDSMIQTIQKHMTERSNKQPSSSHGNQYADLFTKLYPPLSLHQRRITDTNAEILLSEFPAAGILSTVETADNSPPIESILFSPELLSDKFWFAPETSDSVSVIIVFPCYASVNRIVLHTDRLGYHSYDLPQIRVSTAERLPQFEKHDDWVLQEDDVLFVRSEHYAASSDEEASIENKKTSKSNGLVIQPHQRLEYRFDSGDNSNSNNKKTRNGVRLLKLELSLPSSSPDESHPKKSTGDMSQEQQAEQGKEVLRRMLHLGRILVYGKAISQPNTSINLSAVDQSKHDSILKTNQRTSRVQINTTSRFNREINMLDVRPVATAAQKNFVSGFRLVVEHGREGIDTQVQHMRATVFVQNDQNGLVEQHQAGFYIIPRVAAGTSLCYELDRTYENVALVRFEFEQNYGAQELAHGKIFLFVVNM